MRMSETTTVSMPGEMKQFIDENDVSASKLLQNAVSDEMDKRGSERDRLENERTELKQIINVLESDLEVKKEELEEVNSKLSELEEQKDTKTKELVEIIEDYHTEEIDSNKVVNRVSLSITADKLEECYNECIDSRAMDESVPNHLRKMIESHGEDADELLKDHGEYDYTKYKNAKMVINNNISGLEKERAEQWAKDNLEL